MRVQDGATMNGRSNEEEEEEEEEEEGLPCDIPSFLLTHYNLPHSVTPTLTLTYDHLDQYNTR